MIPFKECSAIKQYLLLKLVKRGFKVWMLVDGHTGCVSKDLVSVIFPKRLSVVIVATTATIIGENSDMRQYGIASPASFPSATQEAIITVSNCTTKHYTYSLHTLTLSTVQDDLEKITLPNLSLIVSLFITSFIELPL